jgi:3D (Asp-Asp-Asp) domain-containing protein
MQCHSCRQLIRQKGKVKRLKGVVISLALAAITVFAVLGYHVHLLKIERQALLKDQKDMEAFIPPCMVKEIFVATAYEGSKQSCGKWAQYGRTKTMTTPSHLRTVAVDPEVIPLGSLVFVSGLGWGIAEDTGRLVKGRTIDVFTLNKDEAIKFGRKNVIVFYPSSQCVSKLVESRKFAMIFED